MKKKQKQSQNFMKNEFMWEEPKKRVKLYKNWKLYAIALPAIAVAAGTGSGIYAGVNHGHVKTIDLSTLKLTKTIAGIENMNQEEAFNEFLDCNQNQNKDIDLKTQVEISAFIAPDYTQNGKLTVQGKAKSKLSGTVEITISTLEQVNLTKLNNQAISGVEGMKEADAFAAFLNNQTQGLDDLKDNVTLSFAKPSYTGGGSLTITAKPDSKKYTGQISLNINKVAKIALASLHLNQDLTTSYTDETQAFDAFLELNSNVPDLRTNVEVTDFKPSSYGTPGSLSISALSEGKYDGTVLITIPELGQTALKDLHLNTLLSMPVTNQQVTFDLFIKLNPEVSDLRDNVQIAGFTVPVYDKPGSLKIEAKPNTKYSGTLTITIPELNKTNIARLVTNTTIQGTTDMAADEAFQAFLTANSSFIGLDKFVDYNPSSFVKPNPTTDGSLVITAKPNKMFNGSLIIKIEKTIALNTLNHDAVIGFENMTQADVFDAFLKNNEGFTDLKESLTSKDFAKPDYQNDGKLTIMAKPNTKYDGDITIDIVKLEKTLLSSLTTLNLNLTGSYTNKVNVFSTFLENNVTAFPDLEANVKMGEFVSSDYDVSGSLEIVATQEGKYEGMVKVKFGAIDQKDLSTLDQTTIIGKKGMNEDDAFQAFLANNRDFKDLKEYVSVVFNEPDYDKEGSLVITANKPKTKYVGSITVKIAGVVRIELDGLEGLNKNLPGTAEISDSAKSDIALGMFLDANKNSYPDLRDNVETVSFNPPTDSNPGSLEIRGKNKYSGSITITFSQIQTPTPELDQEIVKVIVEDPKMIFDATMGVKQTLNSFFEGVINNKEHSEDPHWYLRGQLVKHLTDHPELEEVNYDKFVFLGLYLLDGETPLTDEYISSNISKAGQTLQLKAKFNYGDIKGQFVNFSLSFKD